MSNERVAETIHRCSAISQFDVFGVSPKCFWKLPRFGKHKINQRIDSMHKATKTKDGQGVRSLCGIHSTRSMAKPDVRRGQAAQLPFGGFKGTEQLPPGTFRGDEQLPPGGFRCGALL